jgi:signal transduction histidine kinase
MHKSSLGRNIVPSCVDGPRLARIFTRVQVTAANKRRREIAEPDFRPTLKVATHDLGEAVEIRVRDNGSGIPPEIREKLFQPFFTTTTSACRQWD